MRFLLGLVAGAVAGWWLGRDYEFRLWEAQNDAEVPETTNVDPVPVTLAELVGMVTRDWKVDLENEWRYNR